VHAAGAKPPKTADRGSFKASRARLDGSVRKGVPMIEAR
jgi:hypothetical protein